VADEPYSASDYQFPEAYVEGEESNVYLVPDLARGTYRLTSEKPAERLALGKVVYEEAGEKAIDPVEAKTTKWLAIILPWEGRRAILVPPGTPLIVYEVGGAQTIFTSREGDRVKPGEVLGYVLTGKGETRTEVQRRGTSTLHRLGQGEPPANIPRHTRGPREREDPGARDRVEYTPHTTPPPGHGAG